MDFYENPEAFVTWILCLSRIPWWIFQLVSTQSIFVHLYRGCSAMTMFYSQKNMWLIDVLYNLAFKFYKKSGSWIKPPPSDSGK